MGEIVIITTQSDSIYLPHNQDEKHNQVASLVYGVLLTLHLIDEPCEKGKFLPVL